MQTQEYVLRAMATNYAPGNLWDKLDLETCIKAADEIKRLNEALDIARSVLLTIERVSEGGRATLTGAVDQQETRK